MDKDNKKHDNQTSEKNSSLWISVGVCLGVALGIIFDNLAVGIGVGLGLGGISSMLAKKKKDKSEK